jgi:hypothetical protein
MTASNDERQVAVPDPPVDQLIERAKQNRAEFIAALLRRLAVRLRSLFRASVHPTTSVTSYGLNGPVEAPPTNT